MEEKDTQLRERNAHLQRQEAELQEKVIQLSRQQRELQTLRVGDLFIGRYRTSNLGLEAPEYIAGKLKLKHSSL